MSRRPSLEILRRVRAARAGRIEVLPHVVGTGLGVKRRAGVPVASAALVVFVDRKRPDADLRPGQRIPPYVVYKGQRIPTDVVPIGALRPEFGSPPYFLRDRVTKGVVAALARSDGQHCLVSCAHCLQGPDGSASTPSPIDLHDPDMGYVEAAESLFGIDAPGTGMPGSFGYIDAGLALLSHPAMLARAAEARPMAFGPAPRTGLALVGYGPNAPVAGAIDAVEVVVHGRRTDMLIRNSGTGTFPGHSGMLWRTRSGLAMAMHGYGAEYDNTTGSRYSLAMRMSRIADELAVTLLEPG